MGLYIWGVESATTYSELVDPAVQRERFEAQARLAATGDDEAMPLGEDFLRAMEYGMRPSGGMGMRIVPCPWRSLVRVSVRPSSSCWCDPNELIVGRVDCAILPLIG